MRRSCAGGPGGARAPRRRARGARGRGLRRRQRSLLTRLNYTSHIPCNGVEEPKSTESDGLGIQAVFDGPDGRPLIGFGSEPSDLTPDGARRALAKARRAAVHDPEFRSLPRSTGEPRRPRGLSRPAAHERGGRRARGGGLDDRQRRAARLHGVVPARRAGSGRGGARAARAHPRRRRDASCQERMAIASSAMPERPDRRVDADHRPSSPPWSRRATPRAPGWSTRTRLDHFTDEAGAEAAQATRSPRSDGERVPSGDYTVVFGPQPVADLLQQPRSSPPASAGAFYASSTPFLGPARPRGRRAARSASTTTARCRG